MTPKPLFARIVLIASAVCAPAWAQSPMFTDGPAFGGSKVFSEGMNPLGNPARYSEAPNGYYFTYLEGDQQSKDTETTLNNMGASDPASMAKLGNAPWALRTQAYGFAATKGGGSLGLTREEFNGLLAYPDLTPGNFGSGLAGNLSYLDGRRATVDRLSIGGGGPLQKNSTTTLGVSLRVERWAMGDTVLNYVPLNPYPGAVSSLLDSTSTQVRSWNMALDAGIVLELVQGVRVGLSADQINSKHLWDVYLKPQFRAGLQLDLGQIAKVSLESDINSVERMPFPVKQQSSSASLRFTISSAAAFLVGAERRKIDSVDVTNIGATLQIRTTSVLLGIGFQAGQDRPMKGATFMVN
ncbi:MAG: hypothetical protein P4L36_19780 [Holophaga sp.]|nr:hypothetical protein [Holophaga sp.]